MERESWASWSGRVRASPREIVRARDEADLARAVRDAAVAGRTVRVAGRGHSFTPIAATDGTLVTLDDWSGIESFDAGRLRATVRAGTRIADLGAPLAERGAALANQGDVDVQTIAGALATGTHGTGPALGSMSTQVVGLRVVTAEGAVEEWTSDDDDDGDGKTDAAHGERPSERLDAAAVSLGLLGVTSAATLQLVPAYRLHERIWRSDLEECLTELEHNVATHRHFEFWWYPQRDRAEQKTLDPTEAEPGDFPEKRERVDWSHRIFPSIREQRFNEMEYAVPATAGEACFRAVRRRMRERHPDVTWPVEFRTLAADRLWLSPAHGRDTVAISLHQAADLPCDAFFADCESIFREHDGRPHWGKIHQQSCADLARLYPMWERFRTLRGELDPRGIFLNDYLRELFAAFD